jgi:hypothetical protein
MGSSALQAKLSSLEEQLKVLKAQTEKTQKRVKPRTFSSLYGILKGKSAFGTDAIDKVLYRKPRKKSR